MIRYSNIENKDGGLVVRFLIETQTFIKLCNETDQFNCGEILE